MFRDLSTTERLAYGAVFIFGCAVAYFIYWREKKDAEKRKPRTNERELDTLNEQHAFASQYNTRLESISEMIDRVKSEERLNHAVRGN